MKITARITTNGNFAVLTPQNQVLKLSKRNQYNYCTLESEEATDYWQKTAEKITTEIEITNEHVINEYFLTDETEKLKYEITKLERKLAKKDTEIAELSKSVVELYKYKKQFGQLPKYVAEGFKTEVAYQKHLYTEFLKKLKLQFKLKTLKSVEESICVVYTTSYSGRNGGFKHFSRSIDKTYTKIESLPQWSRNKNLVAKKLDATVIESRGNILASECN
jgi:uncharacterized coiled-coil protein SlyX